MSQLSDDDSRAVDWLLDQQDKPIAQVNGNANGNGRHNGDPLHTAAPGQYSDHIRAAQSLLQLLNYLPASDPPADLVDRTLRRIEGRAVPTPSRRPTDPDQPVV